ncbi:MAG: PepSY domain-containing protein [Bacillota bacterium]|nr:PepSY domain-containing protein [Bacillota bacterium]
MKRISVMFTLMLAVLLFAGCQQQEAQMSYIGAEQAKVLAMEAVGIPETQIESSAVDLSSRDGLDYYTVDLVASGQEYHYDIDALTGVVIAAQTPTVAESGQTTGSAAQFSQPTVVSTQTSSSTGTTNTGTSTSTSSSMITAEDAKAKALAHAGLTTADVTFVKSKLDYDDGRQTYDVEFYTADYKEYDYEIDPYTGDVLSFDYDAEYYSAPAADSSSATTITEARAKELALAQVPGATASNIVEFKADYDDGRMEYEGTIVYNNMEYEFEIDAYSGAFRSWEVESIYD